MIEAVGDQYLKTYFKSCNKLLKDNGRFVLQAITYPDNKYNDYKKSTDFIKRYIFPGGHLPSLGIIDSITSKYTQLIEIERKNYASSYATTLSLWSKRLQYHKDSLKELGFNEKRYRQWIYYFAYCEAGFKSEFLGLHQLVFKKMLSSFLIITLITIFCLLTMGALISYKLKNMSLIDVFWGTGIATTAVINGIVFANSIIQWVFIFLMAAWGYRLSAHLIITRIITNKIDQRYTEIENDWKVSRLMGTIRHFYFQGSLQFIICFGLYSVLTSENTTLTYWQVTGAILSTFGLIFESIADLQLHQFKKNSSPGSLCETGLWQFSRHPNYVFEIFVWLGLAVYTINIPLGYINIFVCLFIFVLIFKFTARYSEKIMFQKKRR